MMKITFLRDPFGATRDEIGGVPGRAQICFPL